MAGEYGGYYDQPMFDEYPDSFVTFLDAAPPSSSSSAGNSVSNNPSSSSGGGGGGGGKLQHHHPHRHSRSNSSNDGSGNTGGGGGGGNSGAAGGQGSVFEPVLPPSSLEFAVTGDPPSSSSSSFGLPFSHSLHDDFSTLRAYELKSDSTGHASSFASDDEHAGRDRVGAERGGGRDDDDHHQHQHQHRHHHDGGDAMMSEDAPEAMKRQSSQSSSHNSVRSNYSQGSAQQHPFSSIRSNSSHSQHSQRSGQSLLTNSSNSSKYIPVILTPEQMEMKETIRTLLVDSELQYSIIIYSSRVAQKSYGSEKRFFCPPPLVKFGGKGWLEEGEPQLAIGLDEHLLGADSTPSNIEDNQAIFKNLYISDSDKRKHFCLNLKVVTNPGRQLGIFKTKPLKVISKPSKKKQSAKNNLELCITSGTTVSMFNRIRSQTVSTKYLCANFEQGKFVGKANCWDAFAIKTLGAAPPPSTPSDANYIHYGMEVVLVSTMTGLTSNPLIIRKVDKSAASVVCCEPVSQLHKVAFFVKGTQRAYFSLVDDEVVPQQATTSVSDCNADIIPENAAWTIVGTEKVEYRFFESRGPSDGIVTPVPVVDYVKVQNRSVVEIYGENFRNNLVVWFGDFPAQTRYKCEEFILCEPPLYSDIFADAPQQYCAKYEVPLFLVRMSDGMIFPTGKTYTYMMEPVPNIRSIYN